MNRKILGSCLTDFTLGEIPKGVICLWGEQPRWLVSHSAVKRELEVLQLQLRFVPDFCFALDAVFAYNGAYSYSLLQ